MEAFGKLAKEGVAFEGFDGLGLHPRPASRSAQSSSSTRIYFPPISLGGGPLTSVFDWTWQYRLFLQRPPSPKAKWFRRTTRRFSSRSGPAADSPREARRTYQQRHILGSPSFNIFSARTTSTNYRAVALFRRLLQ